MPGRLLAENVLLTTEIGHGYNKRNIDLKAILKVDLRKAFDSVRWDFILSIKLLWICLDDANNQSKE